MLMIAVKYFFEIHEIEVFVDITPSTFNVSNMSSGLSGVQWQKPDR